MLKEGVALPSYSCDLLIERFIDHLLASWPSIANSKVLVAVSGGPDSTALLHLMLEASKQLDIELAVAHFDHALRGEESRRDARFVEKLSRDLGLPFYKGTGDVRSRAKKAGISLQEAARGLRYNFLSQTAAEIEADFIATAHTADDQAEEILIRLIRGTSLAGLSGIPPRRGSVIRPLLSFTKEEIIGFLRSQDLSFMHDSSNEKRCYLRNRVRMDLMPLIQTGFNPSAVQALCRTAQLLNEEHLFLERLAGKLLHKALIELNLPEMAVLDARVLSSEDPVLRRRAVMQLLSNWPNTKRLILREHLESLNKLLDQVDAASHETVLPGGLLARRAYGKLILARYSYWEQFTNSHYEIVVDRPEVYELPKGMGRIEITLDRCPGYFSNTGHPRTLWISCRKSSFPMILRARQANDTFWPLNRNGCRRLKKFLINQRISKYARAVLPLLACGDKIAAIAGVEIGHHFRVDEKDETALRIKWLDCPVWIFG